MINTHDNSKTAKLARRHRRVRFKVIGTAARPRLSVFRSNKYMYAALINDATGTTLASTQDAKKVKGKKSGKAKSDDPFTKVTSAYAVGEQIAKLAKEHKISQAVFDRGGYRFAGRVKAVALGARANGLEF